MKWLPKIRTGGVPLGILLLAMIIYYGWISTQANTQAEVQLVVYAFSTMEETFTQCIFPAFEHAWESETGRQITIEGSFGSSRSLAVQITMGAPADVAVFSNQRQVILLQISEMVNMKVQPVIIGSTPLVIIARPGNPQGLAEFSDLTRPGLVLLHADPRSSGVGEWSVMAEYGSAWVETGDRTISENQLKDIWKNVRMLGHSARSAMTLFELGHGDALVTYEQDALMAADRGVRMEIVLPARTILVQPLAVIVDDNVKPQERAAAEAFLQYLTSDRGQHLLGCYHLRPLVGDRAGFPVLQQPFTVEDIGGWYHAYDHVVNYLWKTEIVPYLELEPAPGAAEPGE